eukprot:2307984-Prymnesium_polylepis.1
MYSGLSPKTTRNFTPRRRAEKAELMTVLLPPSSRVVPPLSSLQWPRPMMRNCRADAVDLGLRMATVLNESLP